MDVGMIRTLRASTTDWTGLGWAGRVVCTLGHELRHWSWCSLGVSSDREEALRSDPAGCCMSVYTSSDAVRNELGWPTLSAVSVCIQYMAAIANPNNVGCGVHHGHLCPTLLRTQRPLRPSRLLPAFSHLCSVYYSRLYPFLAPNVVR